MQTHLIGGKAFTRPELPKSGQGALSVPPWNPPRALPTGAQLSLDSLHSILFSFNLHVVVYCCFVSVVLFELGFCDF